MSRADLDVDNVFLKKSVDAISRRHFRAEELYDNIRILRIATDKKLRIVPSFSQIGEAYQVRRVSVDPHTCNMYCRECEACMHEYVCDCPDATKGNFCKHIHIIRLNCDSEEESENSEDSNHESKTLTTNNKSQKKVGKSATSKNLRIEAPRKRLRLEANAAVTEEESQNTEDSNHESKTLVTTNNKNHKKAEKSTTSKNLRIDAPQERLRQEANAAVTGFASELDRYTSDETYKEIIQTIKKLKSKIEAIEGHDRSTSPIIDPCT